MLSKYFLKNYCCTGKKLHADLAKLTSYNFIFGRIGLIKTMKLQYVRISFVKFRSFFVLQCMEALLGRPSRSPTTIQDQLFGKFVAKHQNLKLFFKSFCCYEKIRQINRKFSKEFKKIGFETH